MGKLRILIAEDDDGIREGLQFALEQEGYEVTACSCVAETRIWLEEKGTDLCLLDVTLPDGTGYELCRFAREQNRQIPVIFLTACDAEVNVVMGLDMGADDYITKPFRVRELTSRIRSVLRRCSSENTAVSTTGSATEDGARGVKEGGDGAQQQGSAACFDKEKISFGSVTILLTEARVYREDAEIQLTALEYRLLLTFARNRGKVLTRNQLLESIWDVAGDFVSDNTVSVYIKRLREKLENDPRNPQLIQTVRGFGYRAAK